MKKFSKMYSKLISLVTVTAMVLTCSITVFAQAGPEDVASGKAGINTTVYSVEDSLYIPTGVSGNVNSMELAIDETANWRYGVSAEAVGEGFLNSSADFEAPKVSPTVDGGLEITWTLPDGISGMASVYVTDGGDFSKTYTSASSVTLKGADLVDGKTYSIQVTVGNASSKVRNYTYTPLYAYNSAENTNFPSSDAFSSILVDFSDNKDKISASAGLLYKVSTSLRNSIIAETPIIESIAEDGTVTYKLDTEGNPITYGDCHIGMNIEFINYDINDYLVRVGATPSSTDYNIGIHYLSSDGKDIKYVTASPKVGYNQFKTNVTVLTIGGEMYFLLPLSNIEKDNLGADMLANYQETGVVRIDASSIRYNCGSHVDMVQPEEGDRNIIFSDFVLIPDYKKYEALCTGGVYTTDAFATDTEVNPLAVNYFETAKRWSTNNNGQSFDITDSAAQSKYVFNVRTNTLSRKIKYTFAEGEDMAVTFTAPADGDYEITAPVSIVDAADTSTVSYMMYKKDADGVLNVLQSAKELNGTNTGSYETVVPLKAGETVVLWARAAAGTIINLGLPRALIYSDTDGVYTFDARDYFPEAEAATQNIDSSIGTYVREVSGAWEMGYLATDIQTTVNDNETPDDTSDDTTSYSHAFDYASYQTAGADASDLIAQFKKFDRYAKANQSRLCSAEFSNTSEASDEGSLSLNSTSGQKPVRITESTQLMLGVGEKNSKAVGIWFKFTSPIDGSVTFTQNNNFESTMEKNAGIYLIFDGEVLAYDLATKDTTKSQTVEMTKGQEMYFVIVCTEENLYTGKTVAKSLTALTAAVATDASAVSFGTDMTDIESGYYQNGTVIELPELSKAGAIFRGWKDTNASEVTYYNGTITVENDVNLIPKFSVWGDMNADEMFNTVDIVLIRKKITGSNAEFSDEADEMGDIDGSGNIDLRDLVRAKKYFAGYDVTLGA